MNWILYYLPRHLPCHNTVGQDHLSWVVQIWMVLVCMSIARLACLDFRHSSLHFTILVLSNGTYFCLQYANTLMAQLLLLYWNVRFDRKHHCHPYLLVHPYLPDLIALILLCTLCITTSEPDKIWAWSAGLLQQLCSCWAPTNQFQSM